MNKTLSCIIKMSLPQCRLLENDFRSRQKLVPAPGTTGWDPIAADAGPASGSRKTALVAVTPSAKSARLARTAHTTTATSVGSAPGAGWDYTRRTLARPRRTPSAIPATAKPPTTATTKASARAFPTFSWLRRTPRALGKKPSWSTRTTV